MSPTARRRSLEIVLLAAVLALAAWTRVANYPVVLWRGEVWPQVDGDSSYHLRRALEAVRDYPRVPHFDPGMGWPDGAIVPWADGFDLGAASLAILGGARAHPDRAALLVALWPTLLGIALVLATVHLARTVLPGARGRGAALAAGLAAALLPGAVVNSALGRMDHHVVEMLTMVLLTAWSLRRFPATPASPATGGVASSSRGRCSSGSRSTASPGPPSTWRSRPRPLPPPPGATASSGVPARSVSSGAP
jgi:asparagine N-glycosylation enzyme membrane subunit Stt3